jgi:hypothetical protein
MWRFDKDTWPWYRGRRRCVWSYVPVSDCVATAKSSASWRRNPPAAASWQSTASRKWYPDEPARSNQLAPAAEAGHHRRLAHRECGFLEFFAATVRNPHTRRADARATEEFLAWCASIGVPSIAAVQPVSLARLSCRASPHTRGLRPSWMWRSRAWSPSRHSR